MVDRRVSTVGHFWILVYQNHEFGIHFRIVNTNTGKFNKKNYADQKAAEKYAKQLMYWHNTNRSANGKERTARFNKKVVAKYHRTKKQPKNWRTGVNGPN